MIGDDLSLTLLVLGHFTDHANFAVTMNDLALVANLLYGCTNLHCFASLRPLRPLQLTTGERDQCSVFSEEA
jgi:hypothetical protein